MSLTIYIEALCCSILVLISWKTYVIGINLKSVSNSKVLPNTNSQVFLPLMNFNSNLCVISENNDTLAKFTNLLVTQNIYSTLTIDKLNQPINYLCSSIAIFDFNIDEICLDLDFNTFLNKMVLLINYNNIDTSSLLSCLNGFQSVYFLDVMTISLKERTVYRFIPEFHKFKKISLDLFFDQSFRLTNKHKMTEDSIPNLGGITVNVAALVFPPLEIFENNDEPDGIEVQMINEMSRQLNFTPKFHTAKNWGTMLRNGTWKRGLMREIIDGKVEIMIGNILHVRMLSYNMDFGPTLNMGKVSLIVRRPERIGFRWQDLFRMFQVEVWMLTVPTFILVFISYNLSLTWNMDTFVAYCPSSVMTVVGFFIVGSFNARGRRPSSRLILTSWSVFSLLFTSCLSTGIVALLTLPLYTPRVDTMQQLVEQGYYWTAQTYLLYNNKEVKSTIFNFNDVWHRQLESKYKYLTPHDVLRKSSRDPKIVFIFQMYGDDLPVVTTKGLIGHKVLKRFRKVRENLNEAHSSFGVRKNSPLLEPLNLISLRLLEAGMMKHWTDEVLRRWPEYNTKHLLEERDVPTFAEPQPLNIDKFWPIFSTLLIGLAVTVFVFILEIVIVRF